MKKNFNKEFKNEFDQVFKPTLDKELLKEKLDIQPVDNINNIVFNKKIFYCLSILCTLVLIILTAVITFGITKRVSYNKDTPVNEKETEIDVIKMFQDKYEHCNVRLITNCFVSQNIDLSIIYVKSIDDQNINKFIIFFNETTDAIVENGTYELYVNNQYFTNKVLVKSDYVEYSVNFCDKYDVTLNINYYNIKLFEFCTLV